MKKSPLFGFPSWIVSVFLVLTPLTIRADEEASTAGPAAAGPAGTEVVTVQAGGRDLHAVIFSPKDATKPLPAIVYIHGGGWEHGNYRKPNVAWLAEKGYVVVSLEYRLSGEAKWPAQIEDCKAGVRWLRANAAKYNVDPDRIGACGFSAGGHLVACLATMDGKHEEGGGNPGVSSAVKAVVNFFGPADFTNAETTSPNCEKLITGLIGGTRAEKPELWKEASPITYVKAGTPPMLIVQGDADGTVLPAQSTALAAALEKAGVTHELILVKNAGHGLKTKPGQTAEPSREKVDAAVEAFFDKYLKGA